MNDPEGIMHRHLQKDAATCRCQLSLSLIAAADLCGVAPVWWTLFLSLALPLMDVSAAV
jgi:hypothetical protein